MIQPDYCHSCSSWRLYPVKKKCGVCRGVQPKDVKRDAKGRALWKKNKEATR